MSKILISENNMSSGITVDYVKYKKTLYISGWYDTCAGIGGEIFQLKDFLSKLGITKADCLNAFKEVE